MRVFKFQNSINGWSPEGHISEVLQIASAESQIASAESSLGIGESQIASV